MRRTVLTWLLVILQTFAVKAFAANNQTQPDNSCSGSSLLVSISSALAQPNDPSPERLPQIESRYLILVPSLTGMSLNNARAMLSNMGLQVGQITSAESRAEPKTVLEQSPEPETRVRPGTAISLVIATPILITVPSLNGLSLDDAQATLLDTDLQIGQITSAESRYEPGTVLEQTPKARTRVRSDTPVSLVVATPALITVPPLTGKSLNYARSVLSELDLQTGKLTTIESDIQPGIVLEQSPEAGSQVRAKTSVTLAISSRSMVDVPSVIGLELPEARELLEHSGLIPVVDSWNSRGEKALVNGQNPKPRSSVRRGSSVVLTLKAIIEPPALKPPTQNTVPWRAIIAGAALITILGGAFLFMRSGRPKPPSNSREPRVSIHETLDYGTQQVQATENPEKLPTTVIKIHPDQGTQEVNRS